MMIFMGSGKNIPDFLILYYALYFIGITYIRNIWFNKEWGTIYSYVSFLSQQLKEQLNYIIMTKEARSPH